MISPEDTYPGRTVAADANYPEGAIQNETVPDSSDDGTPLDELWGNDWEGFKQAVAKSAGIVPTPPGNVPDTAVLSQILHGLLEIASGRAYNYDDSGVADAYVLDAQTDQQTIKSLFDGLEASFIVGNSNTGASTVNVAGTGVKNIINTGGANALIAGERVKILYRLGSDDWEIAGSSQGTWTPTIQDSTFSDAEGQTYAIQYGSYTKIGNRVFIHGTIEITSIGTLSTFQIAHIAGLPFTSSAAANSEGGISCNHGSSLALAVANISVDGRVKANSTVIELTEWNSTLGINTLTVAELSAGGKIAFQGQYLI